MVLWYVIQLVLLKGDFPLELALLKMFILPHLLLVVPINGRHHLS